MLSRPGFHTSEFAVALIVVIAQAVLVAANDLSTGSGIRNAVYAALAYIISRGLAKYEPRGVIGSDTPAP